MPPQRKSKKKKACVDGGAAVNGGRGESSLSQTLEAWLQEGPFTLVLSSSFFGFYAHAGVLAALLEVGAVPSGMAGSSGGAVIAGMWAAGMTIEQILETMRTLTPGELLKFARPWREPGGIFSTAQVQQNLQRRIDKYKLAQRLEDCAVPVALSTFDVLGVETRALCTGGVASAITASIAVPLFFTPAWSDKRPLVDGGIGDIAGLKGVSVENRVLYHHACVVPSRMTAIRHYQNSVTFCIPDLPFINPFTLAQADTAFTVAKDATTQGLHQVVSKDVGSQQFVFRSYQTCAPEVHGLHFSRRLFGRCCWRRHKQC
mmetsp:Transcript_128918/g.234211  ORF Transcript_128918/g.234211 Transcript_128918/m.234211 type:complete len:316 (-) Transcript_128918:73-1020(-)